MLVLPLVGLYTLWVKAEDEALVVGDTCVTQKKRSEAEISEGMDPLSDPFLVCLKGNWDNEYINLKYGNGQKFKCQYKNEGQCNTGNHLSIY